MEPCLLCDINSVPRGSGDAPICEPHRLQARAAFEQAEPVLRAHLEKGYGSELDAWVRQGVLPGLAWHLQVRDHPPAPTREVPWRPGRPVHFGRDADDVVRLLRELVLKAMEQEVLPQEPAVVLRVGMPDGRRTAGVDATTTHAALQSLVAELVTVDKLKAALHNLPLEAAARAIIDASVAADAEPDELVRELGVLSQGARSLAFVRLLDAGDSLLDDPVEVADQAQGGSGEFTCGWWHIRTTLPEPARQWVELLEGRFPRARRR
jgi:hypothetical protein